MFVRPVLDASILGLLLPGFETSPSGLRVAESWPAKLQLIVVIIFMSLTPSN
jgi:hypothetical protein